MKNSPLLAIAFLLLSTGACASMASFQTADTVAKGEQRKGVGITYNQYTITVDEDDEETVDVGVPAVHGWYRYGLTDKIELHSMVWIPLGATVGAKYQILGSRDTKGLSLSAGFDVGYLSISSGEGDEKISSTIYDTHLPVYAGYRLSPSFAVYAVPRYLLRAAVSDTSTGISHLVGSAAGLAVGKNSMFHLEAIGMYDVTYGDTTLTAGVGYSF